MGRKLILFSEDKESKLKTYLTTKGNRVMRDLRAIFEGVKSRKKDLEKNEEEKRLM